MPKYKTKEGYTINKKGNKVMSITPSIFVGTATSEDGEKIELLTTWGQAPMIEFDDGSQVIWSWDELINEAIKLKQQKEPTPAATDVSQ
ncbi:hypothetical protein P0G38_06765 [Enterococcus casseliflavus]|uniref:hypothetical protein n=1 Tax=Enterococcus casseliflavus TaxID=37734 RepID=UPI0023D9C027|nr:hypothetical protein [Enterococcus casseliflavus]WEL48755.1 hypothetical protein P0G38_06765 [Enterococcus casseliflavus]